MAVHLRTHRPTVRVAARPAPELSRLEIPGRSDLRLWIFLFLVLAPSVGVVFDAIAPNKSALLPLVLAPVLASLLLPTRPTGVLAAFCVLLALVAPQGFVTTGGVQLLRFTALAGLCVLAILGAFWRGRLADTRIRLAVASAQASDARRRAVELNDSVYQNLFTARMWSQMGDSDAAAVAIDQALEGTSTMLDELVEQGHIRPGAFVNQGVIDLRHSDADD